MANEPMSRKINGIGVLSELQTTDKSTLVKAINEVNSTSSTETVKINNKIGDLTTLSTTNKSSFVSSINEVSSQLAEKANNPVKNNMGMLNITQRGYLLEKCINVIGDSISWGANCEETFKDSYANIIRRMIQKEYDTTNHGFTSILTGVGNEKGIYNQMHSIVKTGAWTNTEEPTNIVGGEMLYTTELNASLTITTKIPCKIIRIHYVTGSTRGNMNVEIDGAVVATINANETTINANAFTDIVVNKKDSFAFKIINKGNECVITGISYLDDLEKAVFNNFGKSGLALSEMSPELINKILDCNTLFFAIGVNDTWKSNIATFRDKITYCINYINIVRPKVIVIDLLTTFPYDNEFRIELRRLASSVGGEYIEFSKILGTTDVNKLKEVGFLSDNVHPTILGHQLIAETIGKKIGYGLNSKNVFETKPKISVLKLKQPTVVQYNENTATVLNVRSDNVGVDNIIIENNTDIRILDSGIYQIQINGYCVNPVETIFRTAIENSSQGISSENTNYAKYCPTFNLFTTTINANDIIRIRCFNLMNVSCTLQDLTITIIKLS